MEVGLFSTAEFRDWSEKYVMFLHVTTRLEGRKHDGLLREKGFTGFPSLAFMDVEGNVIAKHSGSRTIEPLKKTADAAEAYVMMREKAQGGDMVARQHLFVEQLGLGHFDYSLGSLKLATMRAKMPAMLQTLAEARLATIQYSELTARLRTKIREMPREEYAEKYRALNLDFFRAGILPEGTGAGTVLSNVMNHAREQKDPEMFGKALEIYKVRFTDRRYARMVERYESQLAALRRDQ